MNAFGSALPQWQIDASRFAVLSRLADDLAHEIKNPLNSMVINLEVLKSRVEKGAADAALERAAVIEHEIRRLHTLIESLLRLLRPAREREAAISVSRVLEELLPLIELRVRLARLEFSARSLAVDAFTAVPADSLRFSLLLVAERVLDVARGTNAAMWLTADPTPGEILLRVGCSGGGATLISATVLSGEESGSFPGISAATALLEAAGGSVEVDDTAQAGAGPAVLLRLPRAQFI
ncbi:MAG: histidine kinase dimerization/phospho-acceptor domain-containing protein [Longimicrobiales bacterium]